VRLYRPLRPSAGAPLAKANPLAKLGAALVLMVVLFISVDLVTPAIALVAILAAVPFSGLAARQLLARTWPIIAAATVIAVFNTVFAAEQRGSLLNLGPWSLGTDTIVGGAALGLRLLGIALSGVLALATTDPTDLADALQLQFHAPPRLAVGTLAAVRLLPILAEEWQILALARRARGVEAGRNPIQAIRIFAGELLALLVAALRRGIRLAAAMDARGFGTRPCRTVARLQRMGSRDWRLLGTAAAVALIAPGTSIWLGSWRFLFG
jgi:energy-coupling factor transport system permease protein